MRAKEEKFRKKELGSLEGKGHMQGLKSEGKLASKEDYTVRDSDRAGNGKVERQGCRKVEGRKVKEGERSKTYLFLFMEFPVSCIKVKTNTKFF